MNRHKLLALAAMLLVPLAACDEGTPPVPVGTIDGQVSIEGQGVDGVTVTMSTGATTTTASGGRFSFASVDGGTYTVTISNYPADASFTSTSQPVTISTDGQAATVTFSGTYIRTASIIGSVTVEGTGLSGVTVRISGMADQATQTDASGQYTFTQLRAGTYEVEVSDFDADVGFSSASQSVTVSVGETEAVTFDGTYVRTAGIVGRVAIGGSGGLAGVTVSLSGIETGTTTTDAAGQYAFAELRAGSYTIGISGYDAEEYGFEEISKSVDLVLGEMNTVSFDGIRLRTAGITGKVSVGGVGMPGVTVELTGAAQATATTDAEGDYAFSELAAGEYTVMISGYNAADYEFAPTSKSVSLVVDQMSSLDFDGVRLRTAGISGQVRVGGAGMAGVMVELTLKGAAEAMATATTNAEGRYAFSELAAGEYTVAISGYDAAEYGFVQTSREVVLVRNQMSSLDFDGIPLRTAGISGQVTIGGVGHADVMVELTLKGAAEAMATDTTNAEGRYAFSRLAAGEYTVAISGYDAVEYEFAPTSKSVILVWNQMGSVSFDGVPLRTAGISGQVTIGGVGHADVMVELTLNGAAEAMATATTNTEGRYAFSELAAGEYTVAISGYDAVEFGFASTSESVTVARGQTYDNVSFDGVRLRTAGISGQVTIGGVGHADVMVELTLNGAAEAMATATTNAAGEYAFSDLAAGEYTVAISGYNAEDYEFPRTSRSVTVARGQTYDDVSFDGIRLRTAGISGQVIIEGVGLPDVKVELTGAAQEEAMTDPAGHYAFTGLAAGEYEVAISGYNAVEFIFEDAATTAKVTLETDQSVTQNFEGMHTRTASISGHIFLDADAKNGMIDVGREDTLKVAGLKVTLVGPRLNDKTVVEIGADGMYMFGELRSGDYRIQTSDLDSQLDEIENWTDGVVFGGKAEGYDIKLAAASDTIVDLPFDITMQTLTVQAMMGDGETTGEKVENVGIDLYPTFRSANANRNQIGDTEKTDKDGTATFNFPRSRVTSPDGSPTYTVYAKVDVENLPHEDLVVSANEVFSISYERRSPTDEAEESIQLLNQRATFHFWVKNIETEAGGGEGQQGWVSEVRTNPENNGFLTPKVSDKTGKSTLSHFVRDKDDLPVKYYIRLAPTGQVKALGERFKATPKPIEGVSQMESAKVGTRNPKAEAEPLLVYEHTGIAVPDSDFDLGMLEVEWTHQTLIVGVHHERTHIEGYDENLLGGDQRPSAMAVEGISVTVQHDDQYGTPQPYEYDRLPDGSRPASTRQPKAKGNADAGLIVFDNLPAKIDFLVKANATSPRTIYRHSELDAFLGSKREARSRGTQSKGAFGKQGGSSAQVFLCPLTMKEDSERADCSTFAYGFSNGKVKVSIQARDYDGVDGDDPLTVFARPGTVGKKDSIRVQISPLKTLGTFVQPPTTFINGKTCLDETGSQCTGGDADFNNLPGGEYEVKVLSNDRWMGRVAGTSGPRTRTADTVTIYSTLDTDGSDQVSTELSNDLDEDDNALGTPFEAVRLDTKISGTVANDASDDLTSSGNGLVHATETVEGATLEIGTMAGTKFTLVETAKTNARGVFIFEGLVEGSYVVRGKSGDTYTLLASNTKPTNVSSTVTTTAVTDSIGSGSQLPRWSYGHNPAAMKSPSEALQVLDIGTDPDFDADFIVLFKDGQINGSVVWSPVASGATYAETAYADIPVTLTKCADVGNVAIVENQGGCHRNVDDSFDSRRTTTDKEGAYEFTGLEEGVYQARLDLSGINHDARASAPLLISGAKLLSGPRDSNTFNKMIVIRPTS